MRQLWLRVHAAVAQGRHRTLSVQRLRPLPQDERHQQATHQTAETTGETQTDALITISLLSAGSLLPGKLLFSLPNKFICQLNLKHPILNKMHINSLPTSYS